MQIYFPKMRDNVNSWAAGETRRSKRNELSHHHFHRVPQHCLQQASPDKSSIRRESDDGHCHEGGQWCNGQEIEKKHGHGSQIQCASDNTDGHENE